MPVQTVRPRVSPGCRSGRRAGAAAARDISPRVGHLHLTLDDLPWQWADYGGSNTVILVGLPPGEPKVRIEAVDPEGRPFTARTVTFTVPGPASPSR